MVTNTLAEPGHSIDGKTADLRSSFRAMNPEAIAVWILLVIAGLWFRPLTPVDETRVLSVAWEMWQRGDFLVPYLNGEPYSHKPPLLQWLIHAGWTLFGVNPWSARVVAPLFALGNLFLAVALARRLWPNRPAIPRRVPLILLGFLLWALWSTVTLYDMLSACFTLLGLLGVARAAAGSRLGFSLLGLAIGGGLLSKGPVILVLVLPAALMAPWWMTQRPASGWGPWYKSIGGAVLLGAVVALLWAIPAGIRGGEVYRNAIFWGQSAGRIANSFAHQRPIWWYLAVAPVLFLPWTLWPPLWRQVKGLRLDAGLRFCLLHGALVLSVLSLISGKQPHYLIPLFPVAALFVSRVLETDGALLRPSDTSILGAILAILGLMLLLGPWLAGYFPTESIFTLILAAASPWEGLLVTAGAIALLYPVHLNGDAGIYRVFAAMTALLIAAHGIYGQVERPRQDLLPIASRIGQLQQAGAAVAHYRNYDGDYQFLGRLIAPLAELESKEALQTWLETHPSGYVVARSPNKAKLDFAAADFVQTYRKSRQVALWPVAVLRGRPDLQAHLLD